MYRGAYVGWMQSNHPMKTATITQARGVFWMSASERGRLVAPAVPVKSTVGAGDSMVAGVVLSLARGHTIGEAIRFGVAAGAASVMNPGTQLCRVEDVERLYAEVGIAPSTR